MNKYQFLVGIKNYKIPRSLIYDYDEKRELFSRWVELAVYLRKGYLDTKSLDTIFGQMQLLEMELDELRDDLQKEKDEKERKSIESKIADREKSYKIRENYLREKTGNDFDELYDEKKKLIHREFLEYKKAQLEDEAKKLEKLIEDLNKKLDYWEGESNYYQSLAFTYIADREHEIYKDKKDAQIKLESIRNKIKGLGEELGEEK